MFILFSCTPHSPENICRDDTVILKEMKALLKNNLLDSWYPRIIDETKAVIIPASITNGSWNLPFPNPLLLWRVACGSLRRPPNGTRTKRNSEPPHNTDLNSSMKKPGTLNTADFM